MTDGKQVCGRSSTEVMTKHETGEKETQVAGTDLRKTQL